MKMLAHMNYLIPDKAQGVYIVFNKFNDILYIGMAENLKNRMTIGRIEKEFFHHNFGYYLVWYTFDKAQRIHLEKQLIRMFNPKLNKYKYKDYSPYKGWLSKAQISI